MVRWVPFGLVSLVWLVLIGRRLRQRRFWRAGWWLGCWALSALTWTPVALSFGSAMQLGQLPTHWWANGVWVVRPFAPGDLDASFWLNIVMTVPQGALLAINWPQLRWYQWVYVGLAVGLTLESGQALGNALVSLGRWVDINGILTNGLGVVLGALAVTGYRHWRTRLG